MSDKTPIEELIEQINYKINAVSQFKLRATTRTDLTFCDGELTQLKDVREVCKLLQKDFNQNYVTKEQHKEDVVKAYMNGGISDEVYFSGEDGDKLLKDEAEQYYNENYGTD